MAALTYLQMTNRILGRITQSTIADVTAATGQALIITQLLNEAQNELWTETTNWYTLYTTRTFATVASTGTYAVASDWGRTIDMMDTTNDNMIIEDFTRSMDEVDPDSDYTGNPTHFTVEGTNYRLYPIPAGAYTIRERYWKVPTAMSANASTSSLPLFCENFLIHWAWMGILEYLNKFEAADRIRLKIYDPKNGILKKAMLANQKIIDRMHVMSYPNRRDPLAPPSLPSNYGVVCR